jgi:hypothetical protein
MKFIKLLLTAVLLSLFSLVYSVSSFAGNQGNSSEGGSVTALVVCEADEGEDEPLPISIEETKVGISSDECSCEVTDPSNDLLACENEDSCAVCLATLLRSGLSIYHANSYGQEEVDEPPVTIFHYNLSGNAGPFIERMGGCPCVPD